MHRTIEATGPARPEQVWDRYVRPAMWPSWSPQIRTVDYPHPELVAGTAGVVRGPCALAVPFRIVELGDDHWSWRVHPPVVGELTLRHAVTASGDGTRTTLDVDGPAVLVLGYLPLAGLALRRLVE